MASSDILEIGSQNGNFSLIVAPAEASAEIGTTARLALMIAVQNNTADAQRVTVKIAGLPQRMFSLHEQSFDLPPNGMGNVSLDIALNRAQGMTGQFPLTITATADAGDFALATPAITLTAPPSQTTTATVPIFPPASADFDLYLNPQEPTHGKTATLIISNLGTQPDRFSVMLDADAPLELEGATGGIDVAGDEQVRVPLLMRAVDRALFGRNQHVPFSLSVKSQGGKRKLANGQLRVPPRIAWYWLAILLLLGIGGFWGLWGNRPQETNEPTAEPVVNEPTPDRCDTTTMAVYRPRIIATPVVQNPTAAISPDYVNAPPPPQAIQSLQFLEMPFPIDGGNVNFGGTDAQFRQASRGAYYGGRINSFFDHYYPLYPAPAAGAVTQGREPANAPIGGNMLLYTGELVATGYSGHPGYDYSPFVPRTATTPLFAAADGIVEAVAIHGASGAYFVRIVHQVPDEGNFMTIYWHLEPDGFYNAMVPRVGQSIRAGERVGTIGNTGWSTGHHLHFEVRFDANRDGIFSGVEKVDPFGFIPSAEFPQDPWSQPFNIIDAFGNPYSHSPLISRYLWVHPIGYSAQIPASGGGTLPSTGSGGAGEVSGCAPDNALPPGGVINFAWSPDPRPTNELAGTGQACTLSVFDANGQPVSRFNAPIRIEVPFSADDIRDVDRDSLAIHWKPSGATRYTRIETELQFDDSGGGVAIAYTSEAGHCALLGQPTRDLVAPQTEISIDGETQNGYVWWDSVTVSLTSSDTDLDYIEYSLDGGSTWQRYTQPLEFAIGGVPDDQPDEELGEGFQPGEGRHLILAAAVDRAGNVEEPPLSRVLLLDPSANPNPTETPTNTPTLTPSNTPLPDATLTDTPLPTATATPTETPRPTNTNTPRPTNTNTPRPTNTNTPRPTNTNTPRPTEYVFSIEFFARQSSVIIGQCTQLVWRTDNIRQVYVNEVPQPWNGTQDVCINGRAQTFTLRGVRFDGREETRSLTITGVAPTLTPTRLRPTNTLTPTPTRPINTPTHTPTRPTTLLPLDFTFDVSWQLSPRDRNTAIATVTIRATGGDGKYTYFRDELVVNGPIFTYEWRACSANPVSFRVTSGDGQTVKKDSFQQPPCAPPDPPELVAPKNGDIIRNSSCSDGGVLVMLVWQGVSNATEYEWVVMNGNGGQVAGGRTSGTSTGTGSLGCDQYSWRVRAFNGSAASNWSSTWRFTLSIR